MDKTNRLELIKKLVYKRQETKVKRKLEREKKDPGFYAQIEHTQKDVFDELVRLDSFNYTSSKKRYNF
jgi:hypothetical protein